jgi:hypothetical protein
MAVLAPAPNGGAMNQSLEKRVRRLERSAGRPIVELVEWMILHVQPKIHHAARQLGFDQREAERIANATMAGTVKSLSSGVESVKFDRQFRDRP